MSTKLFVGSLPWSTSDADLKTAFEPFGKVVSAKVITDRMPKNRVVLVSSKWKKKLKLIVLLKA